MSPDDPRLAACARVVAAAVADRLGEIQGARIGVDDLLDDPDLGSKDLTLFGMGSLDLMRLAARLEDETGVELVDDVLIDPRRRSVRGWAECLLVAGAPESSS